MNLDGRGVGRYDFESPGLWDVEVRFRDIAPKTLTSGPSPSTGPRPWCRSRRRLALDEPIRLVGVRHGLGSMRVRLLDAGRPPRRGDRPDRRQRPKDGPITARRPTIGASRSSADLPQGDYRLRGYVDGPPEPRPGAVAAGPGRCRAAGSGGGPRRDGRGGIGARGGRRAAGAAGRLRPRHAPAAAGAHGGGLHHPPRESTGRPSGRSCAWIRRSARVSSTARSCRGGWEYRFNLLDADGEGAQRRAPRPSRSPLGMWRRSNSGRRSRRRGPRPERAEFVWPGRDVMRGAGEGPGHGRARRRPDPGFRRTLAAGRARAAPSGRLRPQRCDRPAPAGSGLLFQQRRARPSTRTGRSPDGGRLDPGPDGRGDRDGRGGPAAPADAARARGVEGRVTLGGRPVDDRNAGLRVVAAHRGRGVLDEVLSLAATAQADGRFELRGLTPGRYAVQATRDGIGSRRASS